MNKLMQFYNGSALRIARVLTYPTRNLTSLVNLIEETTLYSRLTPVSDPKVSIVPILDQWVQEGRPVDQPDLRKIINAIRKLKRFDHALQISEWMSDKNSLDSSDYDVSVRLCLISKVYGLKEAEHYFDNIPNESRNWRIYGALLNCYTDAKSLEKAEATMQKLRELGYAKSLFYGVMLDLYSKMKKQEKLDLLIQEMEEKGIYFNKLSYGIRLNAYAASAKIEQMEKLLTETENRWRKQVYSALLMCYADAKSLEKAEATMQKMRELGYAMTFSYNIMVELYSKMKKHEKLDLLIQEMEEKGVPFNKFTCGIRLNAYAASAKIEQMEELLTEMEDDPGFTRRWNYYTVASNGYLKVGATEKALATLKKSEHLIRVEERSFGYECLLTLYASLGKKDEVYRIWNLRKGIGKSYNDSYLSMMSSLAKLDDLDGVVKIFEEWEAEKTDFDYRLPNLLITAYCKKGLLEKAESILNRLRASGKEPNASSWNRLALGYFQKERKSKAAETMHKAILTSISRKKQDAD